MHSVKIRKKNNTHSSFQIKTLICIYLVRDDSSSSTQVSGVGQEEKGRNPRGFLSVNRSGSGEDYQAKDFSQFLLHWESSGVKKPIWQVLCPGSHSVPPPRWTLKR